MAHDRLFFPASTVESWLEDGALSLAGDQLVVAGETRALGWVDAVHLVRERTATGDPHGLVGRVKSHAFLTARGAEIGSDAVRIGSSIYEAVRGVLGTPLGAARGGRRRLGSQPPTPLRDLEHAVTGTVVLDDPALFAAAARKDPPR